MKKISLVGVSQVGDHDCFNACIASLTDIELENIPLFVSDPDEYIKRCQLWMNKQGYILSDTMDIEELDQRRYNIVAADPKVVDGMFVAHAVIMRHNKIVHDPMRKKVKAHYDLVCGWDIRIK